MSDATVKHVQFVPIEEWRELQATVDRQRELLRECEKWLSECPECGEEPHLDGRYDEQLKIFHVDNCKLAKELADVKE
jgi:hypothetical protein